MIFLLNITTFLKMEIGKEKNILIEKKIKPSSEDGEKLKIIKNKLLTIREKRSKPFFDDKTQIDLNAYWLSTLIFVAEVLNNENWRNLVYSNYELIKNLTRDEVFHCYKDKEGIKVFLEDYAYLSQLMINLYEVTGKISFLNDAKKTMQKNLGFIL